MKFLLKSKQIQNYRMPISSCKLILYYFVFYLVAFMHAKESTLEIYKNPPVYTIEGQVEKIDWTDDQIDFKSFVLQQKTPIILKKTIIDQWLARKLWNPQYFIDNVPNLKKVHVSDSYRIDFFNGAKEYPMSSLPTVPTQWATSVREHMSTQAFFNRVLDPDDEKYYYYTGSLYTLPKKLLPDITPFDQFWIKKEGKQVNLWMGKPGVTSQVHYDASYNFFSQLYGKKRFLLFAPCEYKHLHMYPMLHPFARQSQVNLENPDLELFPNITKAKAIEAILEPGDVLYLPPFWYHHVTALEVSISVNVWSDAEEQVIYNKKITKQYLPITAEWETTKKVHLVRHFLYRLVDSLLGENMAHGFLYERIYESRYKSFLSTAFASPPTIDLSACTEFNKNSTNALEESSIRGEDALDEGDSFSEEKAGVDQFLKEKLVVDFEAIRSTGREGVLDLLLDFYIEGIVELMFGVNNVPFFFEKCL